ncbi:MAG: nuclear transport factor 2 family protein [Gammaproteobacteria bacterium]
MRDLLPAIFLILLWAPVAASSDSSDSTDDISDNISDEQTLRHIKTVLWSQAYRTQDVALLDSLLHDSFEMIDADGNRSTKAQELAFVANNRWDPGTFEYRIERLQIHQDAFAVVDGTGIAEGYSYKSSNFLIKEDGEWRAIASHVSGVKRNDVSD